MERVVINSLSTAAITALVANDSYWRSVGDWDEVIHTKPEWEDIYEYYDDVARDVDLLVNEPECEFNTEVSKGSTSTSVTGKSLCFSDSAKLFNYNFPDTFLITVNITTYVDGTQYSYIKSNKGRNLIEDLDGNILLPIWLLFNSSTAQSYEAYTDGLDRYKLLSKGLNSPGDRELYFSLIGETQGHSAVALLNLRTMEYDVFGSAYVPTFHYRVNLVLSHFMGIEETKKSQALCSRALVDRDMYVGIQVTPPYTTNVCNFYCVLYITMRQRVCASHIKIQEYLTRLEKENIQELLVLLNSMCMS